jgi:hypothetical protein
MPQNENASFLQVLKRIAREERESADLCKVLIGTVTSANPLKIKISQKIELDEDFLVVCQNVTDHTQKIVLDGVTKEITVKNGLKKGEKVLLGMENGGQTYFVIDRVVI